MIKNLVQIYALIVCLINSIIMLISVGFLLNGATDIVFTEYTKTAQLQKYRSNEDYLMDQENRYNADPKILEALVKLSPEELEKKRLAEKKHYIEEIRDYSIGSMIYTLQWLLVSLIFFAIHWRLYKRHKS